MNELLEKLLEVFSLEYVFSTIIATYLTIKVVDVINKEKTVPTWVKRLITCVIGGVLFFVFTRFTEVTFQCLLSSFFLAVFIYDTAIKVIIRKFKIDYKKYADNDSTGK